MKNQSELNRYRKFQCQEFTLVVWFCYGEFFVDRSWPEYECSKTYCRKMINDQWSADIFMFLQSHSFNLVTFLWTEYLVSFVSNFQIFLMVVWNYLKLEYNKPSTNHLITNWKLHEKNREKQKRREIFWMIFKVFIEDFHSKNFKNLEIEIFESIKRYAGWDCEQFPINMSLFPAYSEEGNDNPPAEVPTQGIWSFLLSNGVYTFFLNFFLHH